MSSLRSEERSRSVDLRLGARALEALFPVYDGSVAHLLSICFGTAIQVQVLLHWTAVLKEPAPALGLYQGERAIDRRVLLRHGSSGRPLAFVSTILVPERVSASLQPHLHDRIRPRPLGMLLHDLGLPTFQRIVSSTQVSAGAFAVPSFGGTSTHRRTVLLSLASGPLLLSTQTVACAGGCGATDTQEGSLWNAREEQSGGHPAALDWWGASREKGIDDEAAR